MALVANRSLIVGSKFIAWSGKQLPKAYAYGRLVNCLVLCRRRRGWVIDSLTKETTGPHVPKRRLYLTADGAERAVQNLRGRFGVLPKKDDPSQPRRNVAVVLVPEGQVNG